MVGEEAGSSKGRWGQLLNKGSSGLDLGGYHGDKEKHVGWVGGDRPSQWDKVEGQGRLKMPARCSEPLRWEAVGSASI